MKKDESLNEWKEGGGHPRGWMAYNEYVQDLSAASSAVDTLNTNIFGPGHIYKITHISAADMTTVVSASIALGYVSGDFFHMISGSKPAVTLPESWDGEIYLKEGDNIRAVFTNTTSGDDIFLVANGVKIPID